MLVCACDSCTVSAFSACIIMLMGVAYIHSIPGHGGCGLLRGLYTQKVCTCSCMDSVE